MKTVKMNIRDFLKVYYKVKIEKDLEEYIILNNHTPAEVIDCVYVRDQKDFCIFGFYDTTLSLEEFKTFLPIVDAYFNEEEMPEEYKGLDLSLSASALYWEFTKEGVETMNDKDYDYDFVVEIETKDTVTYCEPAFVEWVVEIADENDGFVIEYAYSEEDACERAESDGYTPLYAHLAEY